MVGWNKSARTPALLQLIYGNQGQSSADIDLSRKDFPYFYNRAFAPGLDGVDAPA